MIVGHHPNMGNSEYHSSPGISKSHLDKIEISPAHYFAAYLDPERVRQQPTEAMVTGTAIHTAVLEPHKFESEYIVVPDDLPRKPTSAQRNAKKPSPETTDAIAAWSTFEAACVGKTVLTAEQWDVAMAAQRAVKKHKEASAILKNGRAEQTYFAIDEDTGALVKARPDWFCDDGAIMDVKSTKSAAPDEFCKSVLNFRYHLQPAFYQGVIEQALDITLKNRQWYFVAIEKLPPYAVAVYTLPADVLRAGAVAAKRNLQQILDCKMMDHWPAYDENVTELQFPFWATKKMGTSTPETDFA